MKTVLIVEDDVEFRSVLAECITFEGYNVLQAGDPVEALQIIRKTPSIDLILTDLSLPRMPAVDFIRNLRQESGMSQVPVVLLSGWHDLSLQAEILKVNAYLKKPCELDQLVDVVKRFTTKTGFPLNDTASSLPVI